MDPRVIHKRVLQIIRRVAAKPLAALPPAIPVYSSQQLYQQQVAALAMESRDD